jgi:UTP--glucose-1-phosphate uridylyltransferase
MKVRKCVITAAGWGTRFLPITRSQPKEMLPLLDRPLIQYAVEEAVQAGIGEVVMVTSAGKSAIKEYFGPHRRLERFLRRKGQEALLDKMRAVSNLVSISYVRQEEQLGLGHAISTAREAVGDEPFAVILPDDIIDSKVPVLKSMIGVFEKYGAGVLAVERVGDEDTRRYGIIKAEKVADKLYRVLDLVEKPGPALAPSRLGIVGRYVMTPQIFEVLKVTPPGAGGEIQLTDALRLLLKQQKLYAYEFEGVRHDTGAPLGWLKANISLALKRPDLAPGLKDYLKKLAPK